MADSRFGCLKPACHALTFNWPASLRQTKTPLCYIMRKVAPQGDVQTDGEACGFIVTGLPSPCGRPAIRSDRLTSNRPASLKQTETPLCYIIRHFLIQGDVQTDGEACTLEVWTAVCVFSRPNPQSVRLASNWPASLRGPETPLCYIMRKVAPQGNVQTDG